MKFRERDEVRFTLPTLDSPGCHTGIVFIIFDCSDVPYAVAWHDGTHSNHSADELELVLTETEVDVSAQKFKPGDRVVVVDDRLTGRNGSVGTISQVWKSAGGFGQSVILDGERLRGGIPFYSSEVEHYVDHDEVLSRRKLQIVDELVDAHFSADVVRILQDYRLI